MKKLYILKAGTSLDRVIRSEGDFEKLIINKSGIPALSCEIISNFSYYHYRIPPDAGGFIITGSHSMVTDKNHWIIQLSSMIREILKSGVPLLGICFGHQLISTVMGGEVDTIDSGMEIGTVNIRKTSEAKDDVLFKHMPNSFHAFASHTQTITSLPGSAKCLAGNIIEKNHAVCYEPGRVWGVQFHPEFTNNVTKEYIQHFHNNIISSGGNPHRILNSLKPDTHGELLLSEFCKLCQVI